MEDKASKQDESEATAESGLTPKTSFNSFSNDSELFRLVMTHKLPSDRDVSGVCSVQRSESLWTGLGLLDKDADLDVCDPCSLCGHSLTDAAVLGVSSAVYLVENSSSSSSGKGIGARGSMSGIPISKKRVAR